MLVGGVCGEEGDGAVGGEGVPLPGEGVEVGGVVGVLAEGVEEVGEGFCGLEGGGGWRRGGRCRGGLRVGQCCAGLVRRGWWPGRGGCGRGLGRSG